MRSSLLPRPALIMAAGVTMAGLCAMAGTAGAATSHRGTARPASRAAVRERVATAFANWRSPARRAGRC